MFTYKNAGKLAAIASLFLPMVWSNPTLAQENAHKKKVSGQYKRVHQDALDKIVSGDTEQAIVDLQHIIQLIPQDAESFYMLALAHHQQGDHSAAEVAARGALRNGLPPERFIAGNLLNLESSKIPVVQEIRHTHANRPLHGPMLGQISGSSASIWLRTLPDKRIQAMAWPQDQPSAVVVSSIETATDATDGTAVLTLNGLQPTTRYAYALKIDEEVYSEAGYTFETTTGIREATQLRLAFGGGAGFVPQHEHMWTTIRRTDPDAILLLGDNVYIDNPTSPEMQRYCYYRRQSRPEFRTLVTMTPVYSIWDDHDFGTDDCVGGPAIDFPAWKLPVYKVFTQNWVNPGYGGGMEQPGCYYDFYLGEVHFIMLDGRYYRTLDSDSPDRSTMLGPDQLSWLKETIAKSQGKLLFLCSPVPWVYQAKGDSLDTWNGFKRERDEIFDFLQTNHKDGVVLVSADRHRSDFWKIERPADYDLYEFNSSRLTNQHVHKTMPQAIFSYNEKQSFGLIELDTSLEDPTITYKVINIDGDTVRRGQIRRSQLISQKSTAR